VTTVYILAADILAAGLADGFAMPASVPDGVWCAARRVNVPGDKRVYAQLFDADGKPLTVRLKPSKVSAVAGGEVVTFPGVTP